MNCFFLSMKSFIFRVTKSIHVRKVIVLEFLLLKSVLYDNWVDIFPHDIVQESFDNGTSVC